MKKLLALLLLTATPFCVAEDATAENPTYQSEAPLPQGWPAPGPYDEVSEKTYPKYRAAIAKGGSGMSFWTLFSHIKKKDIPMTAPVEMKMENKGDKMEKVNMAFLYQNTEVGTTGADGKKVEVKDFQISKVLNYTWMGADSKGQVKKAKEALDAELKKRGVEAESFRMLGYNGPGTPRENHTYELQAILPAK
ncbi:MAG: heme-binding protein [Akkermansiaceae bacterium]|jgi:hypothetical protein